MLLCWVILVECNSSFYPSFKPFAMSLCWASAPKGTSVQSFLGKETILSVLPGNVESIAVFDWTDLGGLGSFTLFMVAF